MITFLGENLLRGVAGPNGGTHIATAFPRARVVVTLPGIHCTQREAYIENVDAQRRAEGKAPLTMEEHDHLLLEAVDLIIKEDRVLIRPDPERMDLAFEADTLLQEEVSKRRIHFLFVSDPRVRNAICHRGEAWRIYAPPRSTEAIRRLIAASRVAIGGQAIYFYNPVTGARFLTYAQFALLDAMHDDELRLHLIEIGGLCCKCNTRGIGEVQAFRTRPGFKLAETMRTDWVSLSGAALREKYRQAVTDYLAAVDPGFERDDLEDPEWRKSMYEALTASADDSLSELDQLGLSAEYFRQIEWLPGARIDGGEILFDSVSEEAESSENGDYNVLARGLICNILQEQCDLDFINIGRLAHSLSLREKPATNRRGRRDVFVVHFRQTGATQDTLLLIRMQKWGVREHLEEGKDLLRAMIECEEYTEFIMDRRLGCRQLGMNIAPRTSVRKVAERYKGITIWSPYFQREYFPGVATDKIPNGRLRDSRYALALARLLGQAAAPNMILGRGSPGGQVIFDDGDEVIVEDAAGIPIEIVVADHTSTFGDYASQLECAAEGYARPVNRRLSYVTEQEAFASAYLAGFLERFNEIQRDYLRRQRQFDALFRHRHADPAGNLAFRWKLVLSRLQRADGATLVAAIRKHIQLP
jgi:hypothetical protein